MTPNPMNRRQLLQVGASALAVGALDVVPGSQDPKAAPAAAPASGPYSARDYTGLIGMPGFDEALLKTHFALYEGYVKNTNALIAELGEMGRAGKGASAAASELRRRFGWEFNGMRLHELYFENLGGKDPVAADSSLGKAIVRDFGSYAAWETDFKNTGKARGIGWAALVVDGWSGRLFNTWIAEHDGGHLAACPVVLIMDVFEHAFITQYGLKRADYIEAFMKNVNWAAAAKRLG